jgi:hypothetical protein
MNVAIRPGQSDELFNKCIKKEEKKTATKLATTDIYIFYNKISRNFIG